MEDCRTPTFDTPVEFKFNLTPTNMNAHYPDLRNVMTGRRSFTPIPNQFRSPGLSPIYQLAGSVMSPVTAHHSSSFMEFKKPTFMAKPVVTYTPSPKYGGNTTRTSSTFLSPCPPPVYGSNFSSSPLYDNADLSGSSPQLSNSSNSSVLNHTMTIGLLLKSLGLERYCKNFEKAGIDCNNIMNIKKCDLKKIGIKSVDDRNCIMEMFENVCST